MRVEVTETELQGNIRTFRWPACRRDLLHGCSFYSPTQRVPVKSLRRLLVDTDLQTSCCRLTNLGRILENWPVVPSIKAQFYVSLPTTQYALANTVILPSLVVSRRSGRVEFLRGSTITKVDWTVQKSPRWHRAEAVTG